MAHHNGERQHIFSVHGMHCAACELAVEKKLRAMPGITRVEASVSRGEVKVIYQLDKPSTDELNRAFKDEGYVFSDNPEPETYVSKKSIVKILGIAFAIIAGFLLINRLGFSSLVNVQAHSALPTFFLLGLLAGLSTCAALVGGIILSLSKQWAVLYSEHDTLARKFEPHLMFTTGRVIAYAIFGVVLGIIGSQIRFSLTLTAVVVIAVAVIMFLLGLQMIGVKGLQKFQISLPKVLTRRMTDATKWQGRLVPFVIGGLTIFLPCGFTITVEGLALLSGSALQGGLIMLLFVLGTTLPLFAIGLTSVTMLTNRRLASTFLKVAGVLVLFFALFNINAQLNVLGWPSFSRGILFPRAAGADSQATASDKDLAPMIQSVQVLQMNASSTGYQPKYFKVKAGVPVRWEITDTGTSGCTNRVIARNLFAGYIALTPGQTSIKEFTPPAPGTYTFSCWMGMVTGVIEVVNQ